MRCRTYRTAHLCMMAILLLGCSARAAFYVPPGEASQGQILGKQFNQIFTASGDNWTGTTVTAIRIPDFITGGGPLDPLNPNPNSNDQLWSNATISAKVIASFSGYSQTFGYQNVADQNDFADLFSVLGNGYDVSGVTSLINLTGKTWKWTRGGGGLPFDSVDSDNVDDGNHMVTYRILPNIAPAAPAAPGTVAATYVLFWEDLPLELGKGDILSDFDFNDLAVRIDVQAPIAVPEPTAVLLGGGAATWALLHRRPRPT